MRNLEQSIKSLLKNIWFVFFLLYLKEWMKWHFYHDYASTPFINEKMLFKNFYAQPIICNSIDMYAIPWLSSNSEKHLPDNTLNAFVSIIESLLLSLVKMKKKMGCYFTLSSLSYDALRYLIAFLLFDLPIRIIIIDFGYN